MKNPFVGTGVALVTPFKSDLSIDEEALRKLVRYQINNGTNFLVVQGTTGESPVLSMEEKLKTLSIVQEENKGQLNIVFGVGGNDTRAVGEVLKQLPSGIDGILSVSPYYNKPTQKGIIEHYKYIASCTELPIILYNVPGRTGSNVTAETTLEIARTVSNIVAVKEASGDFSQIMQLVSNKPEEFGILSGDDAITAPLISIGVEGVISVVANAYPKKFSNMVNAALAGDVKKAKHLHYELLPSTNMFFEEGNPGGVKISLAAQGIMQPNLRPPLYAVSDELKLRIEQEAKAIIG